MQGWKRSILGLSLLALAAVMLVGCESDLSPVPVPDQVGTTAQYVGADRCRTCHPDVYEEFMMSGHPYKLNRVVDGQPPVYPYRNKVNFPLVAPPDGISWDDVEYVIGGYGWKARFVDHDGYIITGDAVQWNLETGQWVAYDSGETKPYNCGRCHTTGYDPEGHQNGLEGLVGTWAEDGITCEACHGPGSQHAQTRNSADIVVNRSSDLCGRCHYRDSEHRIAAGGPDSEGAQFIKHHEQFDEMMAAGHRVLSCNDCHDPHKSTRFDQPGALVRTCEDCHPSTEVVNTGGGQHTCVACHLPFASKSAVKRGPFEGDIPSHIFRINTDPDAQLFYQEDGTWFADGASGVTLDFVCLRCHTDRDRQWAADNAASIHSHVAPRGYVASSERCKDCHAQIYQDYLSSGHPYKLNKVVNGQPPVYPHRDQVNFPLVAPPDGVSWDDVEYVIGGYGWKARFVDHDGYIITGDAVQWNLETGQWVAYDSGETKPYNCGRCHTTGYDPEGNQNGIPGLIGTWVEDGITCQGCHGPGARHTTTQSPNDIIVDPSADACGRCHYRDSDHRIAAGGPDSEGAQFIKHHEQFDEMKAAGHQNLTCITCHDPHKSTRFDDPGALRVACEDCHSNVQVLITGGGAHTCEACHMAFAAKSAVKRGPFEGDIPSHIFRINTDPTAQMFYQDGGAWFANGFLTLDFTCLRCHTDEDRQWAALRAGMIHGSARLSALTTKE